MPRVLIIPWFFYKSHQLNRYIALYKKLGATKIDILHHNTFDILTPKGLFNFQEQGWKKNIIPYDIVHSFSGGSLIIPYLSHNPNSHYINVFDSGPMFPSIKQTGQFICNFTGVPLHAQRPFELMVGANWVLQALYYNDDLSTTITRLKKTHSEEIHNYFCDENKNNLTPNLTPNRTQYDNTIHKYYNWLKNIKNATVLIGDDDTYLDYKSINFINKFTNSKIYKFPDTTHLNLYKNHPQKYEHILSKIRKN